LEPEITTLFIRYNRNMKVTTEFNLLTKLEGQSHMGTDRSWLSLYYWLQLLSLRSAGIPNFFLIFGVPHLATYKF